MDAAKLITLYFELGLQKDILSTLAKEHRINISRRTLQRMLNYVADNTVILEM